jgi:hypothetical protein
VWIAVAFGAAVLFGLLLWLAFHAARRVDARERARLALAARADHQHGWVLADDDRGIYGDYVPTQIVGQSHSLCVEQWKRRGNLNIKELLCLSLPP